MLDQKTYDRMVEFRHQLHTYPEPSFQQYQTRQRIKGILKQLGVKENQWKQVAKTGLTVDLRGQAEPSGEDRCVAFRADMDALTMVQTNPDLEYKSKNHGVAHMCGHDGHMTCLVAFVPLFLKQLSKVPRNKMVRLLFQPSQQGPLSGAKLMIQEGCLQEVHEVYGFHQWPTAPLGQLWCQQGPVMSEITLIQIKVIGTSGHGSQPQTLNVAIWQGMSLYQKIKSYIDELKKQKPHAFVSTIPVFQAGQRFNVISQSAYMQGSIRSFEEGLKDVICNKILEFIKDTQSRNFKVEYKFNTNAPMNVNTKQQAGHVLRVAEGVFGKDKVGKGKLPFKASQDFAFFTQERPGAFFFLSTARDQLKPPMIHNSNFNFNDKLIPKAAEFWYRLAQDRLGIKMQ